MTEVEQEEDERQVKEPFKYWDNDSHNTVSIMRA